MNKLKKETIGIDLRVVIVIILVLAVVIAVGIPLAYFAGKGETEPEVRPTYLIWECTNGTHNWTELQLVYASVYPDSYELRGTFTSPTTGDTIEYHTYCELSWEINYQIIEGSKGDDPTENPSDEPIDLVPITENATISVTVNHSGNATFIATHNDPHQRVADFRRTLLISRDDIVENFDRVYIYVQMHDEQGYHEDDETNQTRKHWRNNTYRIYLFAKDGSTTLVAHETDIVIDMTLDDKYLHYTVEKHQDFTTYTFHYPKIIGWETP